MISPIFRLALPVILAAGIIACGSEEMGSDRPIIEAFTASPTRVDPGGQSTLSWKVKQATSITVATLDGEILVPAGTQLEGQVSTGIIVSDTTFVLRAEGPSGRAGASVAVSVRHGRPMVDSFRAEPSTIDVGDTSTLTWSAIDARRVDIVDDAGGAVVSDGDPEGSVAVSPAVTTTYTLTAMGPGGEATAVEVLRVRGALPEIVSFSAQPMTIYEGQTSTLTWTTQNAGRVRLLDDGGNELLTGTEASGRYVAAPQQRTSFTLVATNESGSVTRELTITVNAPKPPKIKSVALAPNPAALAGTSTLAWFTGGAEVLEVRRGERLIHSTRDVDEMDDGTLRVAVTETSTSYTITVINPFGEMSETIELYGHGPPRIQRFMVTPLVVPAPAVVTVSWDVESVASIQLFANGRAVPGFPALSGLLSTVASSGTATVAISTTTVFELAASSAATSVARTLTAVVGQAKSEPNDRAAEAFPLADAQGDVLGRINPQLDEDWYAITVPEGGSVFAETNDGPGRCALDTTLFLIGVDGITPVAFDDDDGIDLCSRIDPTVDVLASNLPTGIYYLVVAANAPSVGAYVLSYRVDGPTCGDGLVTGAEECDDGNASDGDGCNSTCEIELQPTVITAPGGVVPVVLSSPSAFAVFAVDVSPAGASIRAVAADPGGTSCNLVDTRVELRDASFALLGTKAAGGPSGTAGNCGAIVIPGDAFAIDRPVARHFVVVRAEGPVAGAAQLRVDLLPPVCGNGRTERRAGEDCDDGNNVDGDGCSATCSREGTLIVEVEPNDTQANAIETGLLGPGFVTIQGANSPSGDDDVYRLVVPPGPSLIFSARTYTNPNNPMSCNSMLTDTRVFLEPAGVEATTPGSGEIAFNDDIDNANNVWCSAIPARALLPGTYFVRVQGWLDSAVTAYFMDISVTP